jgi:hypothetical protein
MTDPTAYHLVSKGAAAPLAHSAPPSFQLVGTARRSGPKPQAHRAVFKERGRPAHPRNPKMRQYAGLTPQPRSPYPPARQRPLVLRTATTTRATPKNATIRGTDP